MSLHRVCCYTGEEAECWYIAADCVAGDPVYVPCVDVDNHPEGETGIVFAYASECYTVSTNSAKVYEEPAPVVHLGSVTYDDCADCEDDANSPLTECPVGAIHGVGPCLMSYVVNWSGVQIKRSCQSAPSTPVTYCYATYAGSYAVTFQNWPYEGYGWTHPIGEGEIPGSGCHPAQTFADSRVITCQLDGGVLFYQLATTWNASCDTTGHGDMVLYYRKPITEQDQCPTGTYEHYDTAGEPPPYFTLISPGTMWVT